MFFVYGAGGWLRRYNARTHTDPLANLTSFSGAMALLDPDGRGGVKLLAAGEDQ